MARTVVAIYDNFQVANDAVRELVDSGFSRDNISIIANNQRGEYNTTRKTTTTEGDAVADETGAGAGVGAGIGAAIGGIGGLLVGLGALTIPGIGPVIAAGPLAVALSTLTGAGVGAVAGGVTGGLLGALIGLGIPEDEAGYYAEGVRRGGVLVTVQADEYNADQITSILNRHDPVDINERATEWRSTGWSGYDPNARTMPTTGSREDFRDQDMSMNQNQGVLDQNRDVMDRDVMDRDVMKQERMDQDVLNRDPMDHDKNRNFTDRNRMDQGMVGQDMGHFVDFDPEYDGYRTHYSTYLADSGQPYSYYVPAYRYGYGLRNDVRYQGNDWSMIESDAQRDWEMEHPGTWDRVKNAIRNAWENLTD